MATWFTSDLHLGHTNVVEYCNRPWPSVDEMNEGLIQNWNGTVQPDDEVVVLGDLALGKLDDSLAAASRLQGKKFLVPGNHDRCWPGHKKVRPRDRKRYQEAGFTILPQRARWFLGEDLPVLLCHFPYTRDDRHGDRYLEHHPADRGMWLLHGHTHSPKVWSEHPRQIHVGVDAWGYWPVSADRIIEMIRRGTDHGR